ncbi:Glycosyltransferase involved in cell wall bisynthesis [Raineyella antarctica]|uniref:Glycosyltransferase involved in cell wall bisynthesis n=1 Tax=Raineyella antarctica TaxID=1577474 RepID=A0A1G6HMV8_9ACTN|nr:glycosyltransferase [Raineyella antarctica]SDB95534.1 Glycosyltransferase involved in cell wall bisynthesis [Raineyella antarctica]
MSPNAVVTTRDGLEAIRRAPTLLAGLGLVESLITAARADGPTAEPLLAAAIADSSDQLTAIAAVHAAAAAGTTAASALVVPLLGSGPSFLRDHAAWALAASPRLPEAVDVLATMAAAGDFTGTLAEATLEAWGDAPAEPDGREPDDLDVPDDLDALDHDGVRGLTVAQLFLHADIDGDLLHSGQGDTGGIATLLVHLGDALLAEDGIGRVLTVSRGPAAADRPHHVPAGPGHRYLSVPLPGPVRAAPDSWALRVPVRRGLRRILRAERVDVLHLRMADVGSWAAADVARTLGIPTVLTLAPDPHALIASREASGALTRGTFGAADLAEHLVFRVRLLRDLAEQAAHLVVFPRTDLARDLRDLLQLDPDDSRHRVSVVPEGVDLAPLERASREVPDSLHGVPVPAATTGALASLDALLSALPPERRGLPLAITVGRLHRVKGMATLVEAWAAHPGLAARCNLLVVGGDLDRPTDDEAGQLARIDAAVPRADGPARGLLLAGHRPNATVAVWLAAVRHGRPGLSAPAGVYVSASLKEEFGIAILEAMASGLVVVAPLEGGPATYVDDGVTGFLVDTGSPTALVAGTASALDLASAPAAGERADRARRLVAERFSIEAMASALAAIYLEVTRDPARHQS